MLTQACTLPTLQKAIAGIQALHMWTETEPAKEEARVKELGGCAVGLPKEFLAEIRAFEDSLTTAKDHGM